jgi:hypothetical protein
MWVESGNVYHLIDGYDLAEVYDLKLMEAFLLAPSVLEKITDQVIEAYVEDEIDGVSLPGRLNAPPYRLSFGPIELDTYNGENSWDPPCVITRNVVSEGLDLHGYTDFEIVKQDKLEPVIPYTTISQQD